MPNLRPPVTTVAAAMAYRDRILDALGPLPFEPLMTLYLTPNTTPQDVVEAAASPHVHAIKLYPAGATTNSDAGVSSLDALSPVLAAMQECDLPLLVHGEVTTPDVDIFDREARFIDDTLAPLVAAYPQLRVVLEHVTTEEGVRFVATARPGVAATITPQHLMFNRNHLFQGGLQPDLFCLPVLKRKRHQRALLDAVVTRSPRFFLGTDSAPHGRSKKYAPCGCAGAYSAHAALALYAQVFEQAGALNALQGFACEYGADFYRLPRNTTTVRLVKESWRVPDSYPLGDEEVTPLLAGQELAWRLLPPGA